MKMQKILGSKAISRVIVAVIAIIVIVAAIGGAYYYGTLPSPSPSPSPSPTPTPAETTFTYSWVTDLTGFDPAVAWTTDARGVEQMAYEGLLRLKGNTSELEPALATAYSISADGLNYTFTLRQGVLFSDGSPFNATCVQVSFQRLLGIGQQSANFNMITKVDVVDPYTVRFDLNFSFAPFLSSMALPQSYIINPNALVAHNSSSDRWATSWFHDNTAGAGPYMLQSWVKAQSWTLVRNPYYWRGWEGNHISKIVGIIVSEPAVAKMMIEKGTTDANYFATLEDIASYKSNPNMLVVGYAGYGKAWAFTYRSTGPVANVHVRKAIAYAFDYNAALGLLQGYGQRGTSDVFPSSWAYNPNGFTYQYNLTKAREELAQSPWPNGGFTISVVWCAGVNLQRQIDDLLQVNLRELNINLNVVEKQWATFSQMQNNLATAFDMSTWNLMMFSPDPDNTMNRFTPQFDGVSNYGWYNNTQYTALVTQAARETNQTVRQQLYWQAMDILYQQDCARVITFFQTEFVIFGKWVHGFVGSAPLVETFGNPWFMWIEPSEKTV
jgi:peptide/nickel transport system substrate-binding protein